MEQDNKKKKKIIGITLGAVGALLLLFSGTYAYWQLTKEQSSANEIVAACLDFELSDVTEAISLERAYPISEEESESLTGYTFKVINNCNDNIDYTIGLNSITNSSNNYLDNSSLRVKLDNNESSLYSSLNDIEYVENVRYSKELGTSTIEGNSENTHLLKVWVDENAPVTEQGKSFTGKIIITGSVGNTLEAGEIEDHLQGNPMADSCFTIANDGTLLGYDNSCGTNVVVPAEINGTQLKKIASGAFSNADMGLFLGAIEEKGSQPKDYILYFRNTSRRANIINDLKNQYCANPSTCTTTELENAMSSANIRSIDVYGLTWSDNNYNVKLLTTEEEYQNYNFNQYETLDFLGLYMISNPFDIIKDSRLLGATSVDMSNAIYLEEIDEYAFHDGYESDVNDGPHCVSGKDFYTCRGALTNTVLPKNGMLTTIRDYAFSGGGLTSVEIPTSVTTIGYAAFKDNNLTSVTIPGSVTMMEDYAFSKNKLKTVVLSEGITSVGYAAFRYNEIENLTIPSTMVTIGERSFEENNLTSLTLPQNGALTTIEGRAFSYNQISKLVIPSSVTRVEYGVVYNNPLTEVIIKRPSSSGINILSGAFNNIAPTYNPNYTE